MFYIIAEREKMLEKEELGFRVGHMSCGVRWKI
jgi:hypothetical protein